MEIQHPKIEKKNLHQIFLVIVILFLVSLTVLVGVKIFNEIKEGKYIGQGIKSQNTIAVSATGEVYVKPDLAVVVFSAVTEEKTLTEALSKNTEKMNMVIDFIKNQGIEEKDLKTTSFNIYPRYEWYEEIEIPPYPKGKRVLVGYEVHQSLQVKIRDMEKIGDILQGATDAGANQVGDLQFTIDKEDEFKKQARQQAIEKAKEKADELAIQLGVNLVRITSFQESSVLPYFYAIPEAAVGMGGGGEAPKIEPGENLIKSTVTITYEIN